VDRKEAKQAERRSFGRVLKALRELNGMTREELHTATAPAGEDRVSIDMIAKIEQGAKSPSPPALRKLAAALGVTPAEIFQRSNMWLLAEESGTSDAGGRGIALGWMKAALPPAVVGAAAGGLGFLAAAGERAESRRHEAARREMLADWIRAAPDEVVAEVARIISNHESHGDGTKQAVDDGTGDGG